MAKVYTGKDQDRRYVGTDADITYSLRRCLHAEECIHHLGKVFDVNKSPWIDATQATGDEIAQVVTLCPSGALHFERKDGGEAEAIPTRNIIKLRHNGELEVRGNLKISGTLVDIQEETRATLCRCGASARKPFCDNSHQEINFQAAKPAPLEKTDPNFEQGGVLLITAFAAGPYEFEGNLQIVDEDGAIVYEGTKTWLCRCGGSSKKPFCDNTHRTNGFDAE